MIGWEIFQIDLMNETKTKNTSFRGEINCDKYGSG